MKLSAKEIKNIYKAIKYIASDGNVYFLKDYYPFCMRIEKENNEVCLDTGGMMKGCDFFNAKIEDNKLFRKKSNGEWIKIANLVEESLKLDKKKEKLNTKGEIFAVDNSFIINKKEK